MNVCFITSTINIQKVTDKEYKKWWTYIGMRQMQQSAMFSCDDNRIKMMGVSPSKLSEENMDKYAIQIMHILNYPKNAEHYLICLMVLLTETLSNNKIDK